MMRTIYRTNIQTLVWNVVITIATSFTAIFIPLNIVFDLKSFSFYSQINILVTVIFILDIFVSIYRIRTDKESLIIEEMSGVKRYLKSWFIVDLVAAIPFGLFTSIPILQLARLLKLVKVQSFMRNWRQMWFQFASIMSILFFMYWFALITNWISCGWLLLTEIDASKGIFTNYISSLYWSITTLTAVGYGDITPSTNSQKIFAIFVEILGVGVYGYLIGNVASILSKKDPATTHYLENLEKLKAMIHFRKIPIDLQNKIRDYYTYMWRKRMGYDESEFLKGLPPSLKTEASLHLKKEVIEGIPLFKDADQNFIREIALHLKPVILTPHDRVFGEGEEGNEMYFVVKGELEVLNAKESKQLAILKDGDFFGEIALFGNKPRTATVKALTYCDLYSLNKKAFDFVISKYDDIVSKIELKAKAREESEID